MASVSGFSFLSITHDLRLRLGGTKLGRSIDVNVNNQQLSLLGAHFLGDGKRGRGKPQ